MSRYEPSRAVVIREPAVVVVVVRWESSLVVHAQCTNKECISMQNQEESQIQH